MRKTQISMFAIATFALAVLSFSIALPVFNRVKIENFSTAYAYLLIPVGLQLVLLAAGAVYSARSKRREVVVGILWGFALEIAALVIMIVVSSSAHY
ncbi:MAG: hypothetical protein ACHQWU_07425 [Gemmatimonadales bacterium]